jgi:hypothetical protein
MTVIWIIGVLCDAETLISLISIHVKLENACVEHTCIFTSQMEETLLL